MPCFIMPSGTRELFARMKEREERLRQRLARRVAYGGRKGRAAARRLRTMGPPLWAEPERVIAALYGPEWACPPHGFATPKT